MATNAERQAAFKAKMRQAGKKQIAIWVDPAQQAAIVAFLAGTGELTVTGPPTEGDPSSQDQEETRYA